jgi:hypothetical protein
MVGPVGILERFHRDDRFPLNHRQQKQARIHRAPLKATVRTLLCDRHRTRTTITLGAAFFGPRQSLDVSQVAKERGGRRKVRLLDPLPVEVETQTIQAKAVFSIFECLITSTTSPTASFSWKIAIETADFGFVACASILSLQPTEQTQGTIIELF